MIGFNSSLRGVRFAAILSLSVAAACGSDDNHGPTVSGPTTTVPIDEGGSSPSIGGTGNPNTAGNTGVSGTFSTGGTLGTGGSFGTSGSFSVGGGSPDPFATAGTFSEPFGGTSSSAGTVAF